MKLDGAHNADICIVGGGFTGLWTALRIKEQSPQTEVVVLEADVCGGGASGRNGGFALSFWHHFQGLEQVCGSAEALRLARASCDAITESAASVSATGSTPTTCTTGGCGRRPTRRRSERGRAPSRRSRATASTRSCRSTASSSPSGPAPLLTSQACSRRPLRPFQPALLARGLMRVVQEQGVTVFEGSPMVALQRSTPPVVRTAGGQVTAELVVLAMNAWAGQVRELRRAFVIVSSDIAISEPVPAELQRSGWRDGTCISDSRLMVHYYRTTRDGRIALGKGGGRLAYGARIGASFTGRSPIEPELAARMRLLYPFLAEVAIADSWLGPIDRTVDGLPFFTRLGRPDLICGAGYSGNGVAPTVIGGRILASLALGLDDEWSGCGLVRKPPRGMPGEPARYVGGNVVRRAVARKEQAEDEERPVAALDRALARLAPAGLVPLD